MHVFPAHAALYFSNNIRKLDIHNYKETAKLVGKRVSSGEHGVCCGLLSLVTDSSFCWRRAGKLPDADKISLDGTSLGHSYSRQKIAVGKNGVFMCFASTELIAKVIS